jgi:hypothetical protein
MRVLFRFVPFHDDLADSECSADTDCAADRICINERCIDGCILPGACGSNAICQTIRHKTVCTCPPCRTGNPRQECLHMANCYKVVICQSDEDCLTNEACVQRECIDPCLMNPNFCDTLNKCETRNHRPICSCKYGHLLSDAGELMCAPERLECLVNEDCATNMACALGRCYNPCAARDDKPLCEGNKTCSVVRHRPVCLCTEECNPSLTMCLRDAGCSPETVCRNYECIDPCLNFTCPDGSHCFVENHVPVCKFCDEGWTFDAREGCVQSKDICVLDDVCRMYERKFINLFVYSSISVFFGVVRTS